MKSVSVNRKNIFDRKNVFVDRKSLLTVGFFYLVNKIASRSRYKNLKITGAENIPRSGPFLLIANHTSRWDGPVLMETMKRAANWMVSPNELKGLQGILLRSVGAFPAARRFDLLSFVSRQIEKGQPVVIFPEGDIYRDGTTHRFKSGAARVLLAAYELGIDLPVISVAIDHYDQSSVNVVVSKPVCLRLQFWNEAADLDQPEKIRRVTGYLHQKLSSERSLLQSFRPANLPELEQPQLACY